MVGFAFLQQAAFGPPDQIGRPGHSPTGPYRAQPTVPLELTLGVEQRPSYTQSLASSCPGYTASQVSETESGVTARLTLAGPACNVYGTDHQTLLLKVEYRSSEIIRVNIVDARHENFDLATRTDIYDGAIFKKLKKKKPSKTLYHFSYNESPFEFWITRISDGEVLFDTRGHKLVFEDQYLELTTKKSDNANLYGLGDSIHPFRLENEYISTLYAADIGDRVDANLYGSHPFYMEHRYQEVNDTYASTTHGVLLMTSNNMDVLIRPQYLQYRVTGGVIDLYVYTGTSPIAVIQQYVQSIGLPAMQSYWTLGFHQCRWGYTSTADTKAVVDKYRAANIPLETIWNDIDYMEQYRDWTLDQNYLDLSELVDTLHKSHQHYVPIVDAAIYASNPENRSEDSYHPYYTGLEQDTFLKNPDGTVYYGDVWPGYTAFPDWLAENTTRWWYDSMENFTRDCTSYDGIWLDMNEVSSFCVGSCGTGRLDENQVHPAFSLPGETVKPKEVSMPDFKSESRKTSSHLRPRAIKEDSKFDINYPPYAINNWQPNADLAVHAVSPNATHQDGTTEYDIHNLFGWGETVATYSALQKLRAGERPFIISRSTFPGAGTMVGHWGGDNYSKWAYLYHSIPQALVFQIFGIPMMGPDTCGFFGNADEEMCSRWMQLSAFFPFYRNHNTLNADPQEAYVWSSVAEATRTAIHIRYSLLPYWYTLFHDAHVSGTPVIRAVMMEFPNDPTLAAADRQFMVGSAIMVVPVLEQGVEFTKGVFPGIAMSDCWYDWYTKEEVKAEARVNTTIPAPLGHIPVFIRGGHILPMQAPGYTTFESRLNEWSLLVALSVTDTAQGSLYQDDGISEVPSETTDVFFTVTNSTLTVVQTGTYLVTQPLANVTVLGVSRRPSSVLFKDERISGKLWTYDDSVKCLYITGLQELTSSGAFTDASDENDKLQSSQQSQSGWTLSWATDTR
ncbi:protein of unknown function [Taphrina deformans PYCC 5710]|uniref:Maltase n=1 Tax=Taphrina deformans (strain PYCC 5710 / ATCC 11124 / CBS 356.35 / IMI 108563 / JCM 9778 / NBRC 8474) TaxID=1097556 RepID=R4XIK6_TAPDE|nr:protein of unknown function [Taphrina deformans PYCC 5710]|eukprot:CCG84334.1 protein of unknown function [Taphrina deformans PYCC 5710]